jgi:hypothetical protein
MSSIAEFRAFFRRYQDFIGCDERESYAGWGRFLDRARSELPQLLEAVRSEEAQCAPRFNIFRTLCLERKEEDFHTPMLAHLLDPSGIHSQGLLFLNAFFIMLRERLRERQSFLPSIECLRQGQWMIRPEFYIGGGKNGGRLDLLIENARKKYVVVIENKIDTDDSPEQLKRYYDWMVRHRSDYQWRLLIYLTPDGRCPKFGKCDCICLSYANDIRTFLNRALQGVKAAPVCAIVRQYLAILGNLTEGNHAAIAEEAD